MSTLAERVAKGVALLDEQTPGWDQKPDLDTLAMYDDCNCVLGQVFGLYDNGLAFLDDLDDVHDEIDHGFMAGGYSWADLTGEWKRVITARRSQPATTGEG